MVSNLQMAVVKEIQDKKTSREVRDELIVSFCAVCITELKDSNEPEMLLEKFRKQLEYSWSAINGYKNKKI